VAEGFGTYVSSSGAVATGWQIAQQMAHQNYQALVRGLFASSACPGCGQFAPELVSRAEHDASVRVEKAGSRLTWTAVAAAVSLVLGLGVAALDRSGWLALLGVSTAITLGALVFHVRTPHAQRVMLVHPRNVAFFWNAQWVTPQASYAPTQDSPIVRSGLLTAASYSLVGVFGIGMLTAFIAWVSTFQSLRVVSTEEGVVHVRVDGKPVGDVPPNVRGFEDAASASFTLRSGTHTLEAYSDTNELLEKRTIDATAFGSTWVFAPRAKEHGACLVTVVSSYAKYGTAAAPVLTLQGSDPFQTSVDDALVSSPASIMLDQNTSEKKRTALRAYDCSTLDQDEPVPFSQSAQRRARKP
jgi:hypothetical protein